MSDRVPQPWREAMRGTKWELRQAKESNIHLWVMPHFAAGELPEAELGILSRTEKESIAASETAELQQRRLTSHFWVRQILALYLNVPPASLVFDRTPNGRRYLRNSSIFLDFNLAHSGGLQVLVTSHKDVVGVDLEYHNPECALEEELVRLFGGEPAELAGLERQDKINKLFDYRVTHDAMQKCLGAPPPEKYLRFHLLLPQQDWVFAFYRDMYYTRLDLLPRHSLAIASTQRHPVTVHRELMA